MITLKRLLKTLSNILFYGLIITSTLSLTPAYAKDMAKKKVSTVDNEGIRKKIKAALPEIHGCYKTYFDEYKDKAKAGKIVMKWVIGEDGIAHSFGQELDEIKNPTLNNCIAFAISSTQFPIPPKDQIAVVSYPFNFNPDKM